MEFELIIDDKKFRHKCPDCTFGYLFIVDEDVFQCVFCKRLYRQKNNVQ